MQVQIRVYRSGALNFYDFFFSVFLLPTHPLLGKRATRKSFTIRYDLITLKGRANSTFAYHLRLIRGPQREHFFLLYSSMPQLLPNYSQKFPARHFIRCHGWKKFLANRCEKLLRLRRQSSFQRLRGRVCFISVPSIGSLGLLTFTSAKPIFQLL